MGARPTERRRRLFDVVAEHRPSVEDVDQRLPRVHRRAVADVPEKNPEKRRKFATSSLEKMFIRIFEAFKI